VFFDKLTVKPKQPCWIEISKWGKQRKCSRCDGYALSQWA